VKRASIGCTLTLVLVLVPAALGAADRAPAVVGDADEAAAPAELRKPIVYVHGFESDGGANCQQFNPMKTFFENHAPRFTSTHHTVAYYDRDTNCGYDLSAHGSHSTHFASGHRGGAHTTDTNIRHLGYHLAWFIWNRFSRDGKHVDVVAHSMGGLIARYAVAQAAHDHPDFPPNLLVDDIVTLGTPHNGPRALSSFGCAVIVFSPLQCDQMNGGSDFQSWLDDMPRTPSRFSEPTGRRSAPTTTTTSPPTPRPAWAPTRRRSSTRPTPTSSTRTSSTPRARSTTPP
jgi:triacylglycerol esterase/lipase EstA (alpha/beta hydrolase family)